MLFKSTIHIYALVDNQTKWWRYHMMTRHCLLQLQRVCRGAGRVLGPNVHLMNSFCQRSCSHLHCLPVQKRFFFIDFLITFFWLVSFGSMSNSWMFVKHKPTKRWLLNGGCLTKIGSWMSDENTLKRAYNANGFRMSVFFSLFFFLSGFHWKLFNWKKALSQTQRQHEG